MQKAGFSWGSCDAAMLCASNVATIIKRNVPFGCVEGSSLSVFFSEPFQHVCVVHCRKIRFRLMVSPSHHAPDYVGLFEWEHFCHVLALTLLHGLQCAASNAAGRFSSTDPSSSPSEEALLSASSCPRKNPAFDLALNCRTFVLRCLESKNQDRTAGHPCSRTP